MKWRYGECLNLCHLLWNTEGTRLSPWINTCNIKYNLHYGFVLFGLISKVCWKIIIIFKYSFCCFLWVFFVFDFWFWVVIHFFIPTTTANDLRLCGFPSQILSITFLSYLNSRDWARISLLLSSAKQGNYSYHFYNVFGMTRSSTGDWTMQGSQHSTTRLSRRWSSTAKFG